MGMSRRDFVKTASIGAGGAVLVGLLPSALKAAVKNDSAATRASGAEIFKTHQVFAVYRNGEKREIANPSNLANAQLSSDVKAIEYVERRTGLSSTLNPACDFYTKESAAAKAAGPASTAGLRLINDIEFMRSRQQEVRTLYTSDNTVSHELGGTANQMVFSEGTFCAPGGEGGNIVIGNAYWSLGDGKQNELGFSQVQIEAKISNTYLSVMNYDGKPEMTDYVSDQIWAIARTLGINVSPSSSLYWEKEGVNRMVDYIVMAYNLTAHVQDGSGQKIAAEQAHIVCIPKGVAQSGMDRYGNQLIDQISFLVRQDGRTQEWAGLLLGFYSVKFNDYDGKSYLEQVATPFDVRFKGLTGIDRAQAIPSNFTIGQNYPNPFNPSTAIKFGVPKASHVSIRVYDVIGREVAVLTDGIVSPGLHEAVFNAGNLPSGTYFCRMFADGFASEAVKMALVK